MSSPPRAPDIALVTSSGYPECLPDEQLLIRALAARGVRAAPVIWDDPAVDWSAFRLALVRTAWDSDLRRDAFVAWAERAGALCPLWNPPEVLRWNTHKGYLRELESRGVAIVPTRWWERGSAPDVEAQLAGCGWSDVVLKPAVSAGARDTLRVRGPQDLAAARALVERVLPHKDLMVQPYLASVESSGERSLLFLGGEHTHAIRKWPALSGRPDYDPLAADVEPVPSSEEEHAFARRVLAATGFELLYARVDVARDDQGALRLMELELTEPNLFLRQGGAGAVERLVDALLEQLG